MHHQFADSSPGADFPPTNSPLLPHEAQLAELMSALGASTVRAVVFDLETRLCHESWQINEYGESSSDGNDSGAINQFVTAMGTIAQLSQTPATDTLIRQLNPRRCAFAWHLDERRMAVAETRYRLPQTGRRDQDAAVLREIFLARLQRQAPNEAPASVGLAPLSPHTDDGPEVAAVHRADGRPQPLLPARSKGGTDPDRSVRSSSKGLNAGLIALILFSVMAAAAFLMADRHVQSLQSERLRLQAKADATMTRQLTDVLAQGDYGEVQAELNTFAELGYFQDAVVTNAQRRVIALVGTAQGARIGNIMASDDSGMAKVVALRGQDQQAMGQLMTWTAATSAAEPFTTQRAVLIAASLLSLAALAVAAWWLIRLRAGLGGAGRSALHGRKPHRFGRRTSA